MRPENLYFGGGVGHTVLSPVVVVALLVTGYMVCVAPRHRALAALLSAAILIPTDQVLMLGSVHFPALRVVAVFGLVRAIISKLQTNRRIFSGRVTPIDVALLVSMIVTAIDGVLLWRDVGALIFQLGNLLTLAGIYFALRSLIRTEGDVVWTLKALTVIGGVVAVIMSYEQLTGHNPYAWLGGARSFAYATVMERDDKFRAVASFGHPILAGTFGAILLPVFVGLWWKGKKLRKYAIGGAIASVVITIASASSTPIMALGAGILGLCMWPVRKWMRAIRWGIVFTLVSLHMVMKAPVWNLIARVDVVGGSSSDHRYQLVNQFILHFWDWCLIGTTKNAEWGWGMWDTCNQYVAVGEAAGFIPFALLITVIVYGFKFLGKAREVPGTSRKQALFLWSLTIGVFANVVAFFGISYFDQTIVAWYALLAVAIAMATTQQKRANKLKHGMTAGADEQRTLKDGTEVPDTSQVPSFVQFNEDLHANFSDL